MVCISYNIIKAINQFYHFDHQFDCSMLEDTDIFEVLTFEDEEFEEVIKCIPTSLDLQKQKDNILNKEKDCIPAPLLFVHNEFEQQYHQPIRKKSLQAFIEDNEKQDSERRQKEQLKEKSTFEDSKEIYLNQAKPVMQSMFNISYFCQNSTAAQHSRKKQFQNVSLKSNIVIKATPKIQNQQNKVTLIHKESNFYWLSDSQVEIDVEIIKNLYDEMLEKQCYLPIFAFHKFEKWNKAKSKSREYLAEKQKVLKNYLVSYTSFLNKHYSSQFHLILQRLSEARSISSVPCLGKKSSKDAKKYSQETFPRKYDLGTLIEGLYQFIVTSKTEILRKTVMQKIRSLFVTRKQCETLRLADYSRNLFEKQEENWKVLAEIDFLLSLQKTENYCLKKMQAAKDRKCMQFWHKYMLSTKDFIEKTKESQLLHLYI